MRRYLVALSIVAACGDSTAPNSGPQRYSLYGVSPILVNSILANTNDSTLVLGSITVALEPGIRTQGPGTLEMISNYAVDRNGGAARRTYSDTVHWTYAPSGSVILIAHPTDAGGFTTDTLNVVLVNGNLTGISFRRRWAVWGNAPISRTLTFEPST